MGIEQRLKNIILHTLINTDIVHFIFFLFFKQIIADFIFNL